MKTEQLVENLLNGKPYDIPDIITSLRKDVMSGVMTLRDAAVELNKAGWSTFVDINKTRSLLNIQEPISESLVDGDPALMAEITNRVMQLYQELSEKIGEVAGDISNEFPTPTDDAQTFMDRGAEIQQEICRRLGRTLLS